jgi:hypothetical protein
MDIHTDHLPVGGNGGGNVPRNGSSATPQVKNCQTRPQERGKASVRRLQGAGIEDALRPFWHMGSMLCSAYGVLHGYILYRYGTSRRSEWLAEPLRSSAGWFA